MEVAVEHRSRPVSRVRAEPDASHRNPMRWAERGGEIPATALRHKWLLAVACRDSAARAHRPLRVSPRQMPRRRRATRSRRRAQRQPTHRAIDLGRSPRTRSSTVQGARDSAQAQSMRDPRAERIAAQAHAPRPRPRGWIRRAAGRSCPCEFKQRRGYADALDRLETLPPFDFSNRHRGPHSPARGSRAKPTTSWPGFARRDGQLAARRGLSGKKTRAGGSASRRGLGLRRCRFAAPADPLRAPASGRGIRARDVWWPRERRSECRGRRAWEGFRATRSVGGGA